MNSKKYFVKSIKIDTHFQKSNRLLGYLRFKSDDFIVIFKLIRCNPSFYYRIKHFYENNIIYLEK